MRTATRSSQSRAVRQVRGFDGWGLRLPRWRPQSADARSWFQPGPSPSSRSSIRTPRDRILATRFGLKAADLAHEGRYGRMAALHGDAIVDVSLEEATREVKTVPPEWYEVARSFFG